MNIISNFDEISDYHTFLNKRFSEKEVSDLNKVVDSILLESLNNNYNLVNDFLEREIKKDFANANYLIKLIPNKENEEIICLANKKIDEFYPNVLIKAKDTKKDYLEGRMSLGPDKKDFEYVINNPHCINDVLSNGDSKMVHNQIIVFSAPNFDSANARVSYKKDYVNLDSITHIYKIIKNIDIIPFVPDQNRKFVKL
jgi:hypothetical protein